MKHCCEGLESAVIWGLIKRQKSPRFDYWFLGKYDKSFKNPNFDEPFMDLDYCPFCGSKFDYKEVSK